MCGLVYGSIKVHTAKNLFSSSYDHLAHYITKHAGLSVSKTYRVIHKPLPGFPTSAVQEPGWSRRRGACQQRENNPSFCPTLQMLNMSTLGDAADVNPVTSFLPHTLQHLAVDSSDCLHDPSSQNQTNLKLYRVTH
jgi:hypothetical protein